ncbi:6-N-hydroxylaminopurine resistance protein [Nocardia africana]|uniref:6-N-hydroxylaminopurine resistance protein n=1 Tax=Nocardia africana TaxID=134964 RepID=A0A378WMB0_9NOCA|nr:6-N-hydroxylaminopurine resistance protein [Nocardia africana]
MSAPAAPREIGAIGHVLAVCVLHAELEVPAKVSRVGRTAIDKRPVASRVAVRALGLAGDRVCDTKHHGGVHQAVYAYADEDARRWGEELGRTLAPGWFGENLRVSGLPVSDAVLGERWRIGDTLLEVSAPRVPCATFGHWSGEKQWVKRFTLRADTGAYLRVLTEGTIGAGDRVHVDHIPEHGITVRDLFTGHDPARLEHLLAAEPTISDDVRMQIARHARRAAGRARAAAPSEGFGIAAATDATPSRTTSRPAATGAGTPHAVMPSGAAARAKAADATACGDVERGDRP